jgi:hypothetical protein
LADLKTRGDAGSSGRRSTATMQNSWLAAWDDPCAVDPSLVRTALSAIQDHLAHHFDPKRQLEYDNISYCPGLRFLIC